MNIIIKYDVMKLIEKSHENIECIFGQNRRRENFQSQFAAQYPSLKSFRDKKEIQLQTVLTVPSDLQEIILDYIKEYNATPRKDSFDLTNFEETDNGVFMSDGLRFSGNKEVTVWLYFNYKNLKSITIEVEVE